MHLSILSRWLFVLVPLAFAAGCERSGDVSGRVSFRGSPVPGGWVTLTYPDGQHSPVSGAIHPDGTFRIDGCPAGEARVTVRATPSSPVKKATKPNTSTIPARYADPVKTDLVVTVRGGEQELDLTLAP